MTTSTRTGERPRGIRSARGTGTRQRLGREAAALAAIVAAAVPTVVLGAPAPAAAASPTPALAVSTSLVWQQVLPDAGAPIAQSSPTVATLDGGGPSVVVGDRAGNLYAFHLSDGSAVPGWPAHVGAPVDSTPSAAVVDSSGLDSVFVGGGNAGSPNSGGYYAFNHAGGLLWSHPAVDPNGSYGVQAGLAEGTIEGVPAVVAPSLGQEEYAYNAVTGAVLPGWPFFTADSGFTTPSLADLSGNGQVDVVEGGDSTAGSSYGVQYTNGGHLRVLGQSGNLLCHYDTNQTVDSSTAVGPFLAGGGEGIAFGTGSFYPGASDTDMIFAAGTGCNVVWSRNLGGNTVDSPALGDVLGNGQLEVVEGADTGSGGLVWVLNGATGAPLPGWPKATSGQIIGGITTADLTGGGYNDVLVPTTNGLVIFDGQTAQVVATLGQGVGLQNSALVTKDPNGTTGITIAGYDGSNAGIIQHYEVAGSTGHGLGLRSWPEFHQNPQLTGVITQPPPGHLNAPIVGMAATPNGGGYWNVASDGGIFSFGNAHFYGSMGGHPLNQPIVGMAATPDGRGYWEVASDGGIFSFGDAQFYGSMGGHPLNAPIVGMAATPDGRGYWEVASDGGIFSFGDAQFYGSMGGHPLNQPVVGMAATPGGGGYWEVASDGGIFSFGDAPFYGSMGGHPLNQPVVGIASNGSQGYWEVASDGGIFSFGDAPFYGSMGGHPLDKPVVGIAVGPSGQGYWMDASDGGMFSFGSSQYYGSMPAVFAAQAVGVD